MAKFESGDFKKIRITEEELAQFRENATRDLAIADKAAQPEVTFEFAYKALVKLAIAQVAKQGYKVSSRRGHHIRLIEKLSESIGDDRVLVMGNAMRSKRNQDLYGGGIVISEKEAAEYLAFVRGCFEQTA